MRKLTLVCLALLLAAGSAFAVSGPQRTNDFTVSKSGPSLDEFMTSAGGAAKQDTIYLLGGPNRGDGKFQNDNNPSLPDDEGWTGVDMTVVAISRWHVSTYNSPTGTPAAWCGQEYAFDCGTHDFAGYGNNWLEYLDWTGTVANPNADTVVRVTATISYDIEENLDWLALQYETGSGWSEAEAWNPLGVAVPVDEEIIYSGGDYANGDEVHLRWSATSDGGWSDEDCDWPSRGHSQLDDISVYFDGVLQTFDNFNSGSLGNWVGFTFAGVGDFTKVWPLLEGTDICVTNNTPQFAYIDDGAVVPGVGPSTNTIFTYGPNSYTRNATGGRGVDGVNFLDNNIWSPPLEFPGSVSGAIVAFNCWIHSEYATPNADGIMQHGMIRCSTDGGNSWNAWVSLGGQGGSLYGGPSYGRKNLNVTSKIVAGTTHVQLSFGMWEYDGWGTSPNGTPASWYDNIVFKVFNYTGPVISFTHDIDLPNDQFAKNLNLNDLPSNALRFDRAGDILDTTSPLIVHGDSILFNVSAVRAGSALVGRPEMHFKIKCNPLFTDRVYEPVDGYIENVVLADSVFTSAGALILNRWAFDLPDGGVEGNLLYPGDQMHFYISATDRVGGDPNTDVTVTLPSNLSAYGVFPGEEGYVETRWPYMYIYRGLPSVSDTNGTQPEILFWNDFGVYGGLSEWKTSLSQLGFQEGIDYDIYYCQAPSSAVGNGLGINASQIALAGYSTILYSSGYLDASTIVGPANPTNTDDKSNDIAMLEDWLETGKNLFVTGDGVVGGTASASNVNGLAFVNNWLGCDYIEYDVLPLLDTTTPLVVPTPSNVVGFNSPFVAYGSCLWQRNFNAINRYPAPSTSVIAEFVEVGAFPDYAAMVSNYRTDFDSKIVTSCVDFFAMYTPYGSEKDDPAPLAARTQVLSDILVWFGFTPDIGTTPTPSIGVFSAKSYPNPFNPVTKIEWSIPRAGDLSIKVFNVKGELVRTLHDGFSAEQSGVEEWNGTSDNGRDVASGIYFYEVRSGDNVSINKMTLVK